MTGFSNTEIKSSHVQNKYSNTVYQNRREKRRGRKSTTRPRNRMSKQILENQQANNQNTLH